MTAKRKKCSTENIIQIENEFVYGLVLSPLNLTVLQLSFYRLNEVKN